MKKYEYNKNSKADRLRTDNKSLIVDRLRKISNLSKKEEELISSRLIPFLLKVKK